MVNIEADFNENCTDVIFKETKWKFPLGALKAIQIEVTGNYHKLNLTFDHAMIVKIMAEFGSTKKKWKDKRSLKFSDRVTLRDFVFHLKRLYHLHRRSKLAQEKNNIGEKIVVTEK